ncbi:DUF1385 domain-containing protein [Candidatus Bipolaricaulota bacterium]|nr:DUF1385 domain-containing protein [Candidatus Bipolaricaulota bacterium]
MSVPVVGGQALIEGVMMQNGGRVAIAVRRVEDGEIIVQDLPARGRFTRASRIPLLRGLFRLYDMLSLGIRALNLSASIAFPEEDQPGTIGSTLTFLAAILIAVGGFIVLPLYLASIIPGLHEGNSIILNLVEGAIRISFFLLYLVGISRMKEIRRVFQYHGAEHKTVYAYEAGEDLTIMNAQKHTTLHPRCGTAFLVIVLIISILIFSLAGTPALWVRILLRLLLLPVVAGVSYELLRFSGRNYDRLWVKVLIKPGLWMQRLTTAEPSDDMVEVAIASLKRVTLPPPEQPAPPSL